MAQTTDYRQPSGGGANSVAELRREASASGPRRASVGAGSPASAAPAAGGPTKPPRNGRPARALTPEPKKAPKPKKQHGIATSIFLAIGMTCLVAGIGTLGWVAWELWGTNIGVRDEYVNQIGEMEDMWAEDPAAAPAADPGAGAPAGDDTAGPAPMIHYDLGRGFAILDIPKLGLRAPVLAGTDESSLSRGVGWEVYTSLPGQVGNFVVAGHHSSRGHPFDKLQSLVVGDRFTVETKDTIYTYEIFQSPGDLTVQFTDTWVTLPDPINRSTEATRKIATLVTCKEVFSTPLRSVGFAELVSETPKG